jgi:thioredoxin 1
MSKKVHNVYDITSLKEFAKITTNANLSVFDFYKDDCMPCQNIKPFYELLSTKYNNVAFYKINTDSNSPDIDKINEICEVTSLPTFCFFKNGSCIGKTEGANNKVLEELINKHS